MLQTIEFSEMISIISNNKTNFDTMSSSYYLFFKSKKKDNGNRKIDFYTSESFERLNSIYCGFIEENSLKYSEKELLSLFFFVNTNLLDLKDIFLLDSLNKECFRTPCYDDDGAIIGEPELLNESHQSRWNFKQSVYSPFKEASHNQNNRHITSILSITKRRIETNYKHIQSQFINQINPEALSNGFFKQLDKETKSPDKISIPKNVTNKLELKIFESSLSKIKLTKNVLDIIKKINTGRHLNIGNTGEIFYTNELGLVDAILKNDETIKDKKYFINYICSIYLNREILDSNVPLFVADLYLDILNHKYADKWLESGLIYLEIFKNIKTSELTKEFVDKLKNSFVVENIILDKTPFNKRNNYTSFTNEELSELYFNKLYAQLS